MTFKWSVRNGPLFVHESGLSSPGPQWQSVTLSLADVMTIDLLDSDDDNGPGTTSPKQLAAHELLAPEAGASGGGGSSAADIAGNGGAGTADEAYSGGGPIDGRAARLKGRDAKRSQEERVAQEVRAKAEKADDAADPDLQGAIRQSQAEASDRGGDDGGGGGG
eukprot:SAG11_NODE_7547_length_1130_cov_1.315228_2_plen_164_part_00